MDMEQVSRKSVWRNLKNKNHSHFHSDSLFHSDMVRLENREEKAMSINLLNRTFHVDTRYQIPCQRALWASIIPSIPSFQDLFWPSLSHGTWRRQTKYQEKYQRKKNSYERESQQCPFTCPQSCCPLAKERNWFDIREKRVKIAMSTDASPVISFQCPVMDKQRQITSYLWFYSFLFSLCSSIQKGSVLKQE